MPIRWDSLLVRHVARELDETLRGARLRAIRLDGRARDIALLFRDQTLLWRLHPERGFPLLREAIEPEDTDLRLKARLRRIVSPPDERILVFEFAGERSGQRAVDVVVELLGNQMNALVVEGPDRTIRHLLRRRDGSRPARVGSRYQPPPPTGRSGVDGGLSLADWRGVVAGTTPSELAGVLTRRIAWISPLNVGAFLAGPGGLRGVDGTIPGAKPDVEDGLERCRHAWSSAASGTTTLSPVVLATDRGSQPYPFPLSGYRAHRVDSLLAAFEMCADERTAEGDETPALAIGPELLAALVDAVSHIERRVRRLQSELDEREDPRALRSVGDLILARYPDISAGAKSVTLKGFAGEDVTVELDPTLPPHQNASLHYDRAGRSERAAERIPGLIERAVEERDRLSALLDSARSGTASAQQVRSSLPRAPVRRKRGDLPPSLPYRTFRSSGGLEIRVGRGSRHNDDLTFRHSAPNDVWLHARHMAGAHVILRWPGPGNPPARDLEEAGVLAALHSKARTSATVPVDWTLRKHVRKPRGAPPGSVVPDRVKTVFVRPDAALIDALTDET